MNSVIMGCGILAIGAASLVRAAEPPASFRIEAAPTIPQPLGAQDLKRLAKGQAPGIASGDIMPRKPASGFFYYVCGRSGLPYHHNPPPELWLVLKQDSKITACDLISLKEPQGMRVRRSPDGAISQASSQLDSYFISRTKDYVRIERFDTEDCSTTPDGSLEPQHDALCQTSYEVREGGSDPKAGTRKLIVHCFTRQYGHRTNVLEFEETNKRMQLINRFYRGLNPDSSQLLEQLTQQRVIWKEGPGFRHISKMEVMQKDGSLKTTKHEISSWKVDKDGTRHLADKQILVALGGKEPDEESDEHHDEAVH